MTPDEAKQLIREAAVNLGPDAAIDILCEIVAHYVHRDEYELKFVLTQYFK